MHVIRQLLNIGTHLYRQLTFFRITALDIPEQLVLRGTSDEDLLSILAQFRKRLELKKSDHDAPQDEIDKRTVRALPLLLNFGMP